MRLALLMLLAGCSVQYSLAENVSIQADSCIDQGVLRQSVDAWNLAVGSHFEIGGTGTPLHIGCAVTLAEPADAAADWDYAGNITILQKWADAPTDKLKGLYVHELGHTLGATHDQGETSAMFWVAHSFEGISAEDVADVQSAQH